MSCTYRVVLVGVGGVGKSCLTIQFISDKFVEDYDPTLEDSYRKQLTVDDEEVLLDIFDTAGQEDFSAVRDQYMRTGDGFLCVYSITLTSSFTEVKTFYEHILRVKDVDKIPFVCVGNKCDLENERKVTKEEGEKLARDLQCHWMETSAKTKVNVRECFIQLVQDIRSYQAVVNEQNETQDDQSQEPVPVKKTKKKGCFLF